MNQREALVTLIEFVREQANEDKRILRALKVCEKRAEVLRERYERRSRRRECIRCRAMTSGLLCWRCWQVIPDELQSGFEVARTVGAKRAALRAVYEYLLLPHAHTPQELSTINPQP